MPRRLLFFALLAALARCARRPQTAGPLPPEAVPRLWQRTELSELPGSSAPDPIPAGGAQRVVRAVYEGPGRLEVTLYELTSSALALDMAQRWRPAADTVFFYQGAFFVVVRWQQAERKS